MFERGGAEPLPRQPASTTESPGSRSGDSRRCSEASIARPSLLFSPLPRFCFSEFQTGSDEAPPPPVSKPESPGQLLLSLSPVSSTFFQISISMCFQVGEPEPEPEQRRRGIRGRRGSPGKPLRPGQTAV